MSSETYDKEDGIRYVSFDTGEPSYCVEIDDHILLEIGIHSGRPTGYRVFENA